MTPELRTERLVLMPYFPEKVTQQHVDWLNDPEVVKYSRQRFHKHDRLSQANYVWEFGLGGHLWLIMWPTGVEIGTIGVTYDAENDVGDMGLLIGDKSVWGHGLATEAWAEVMRWCFEELKLRKIECGCMSLNLGMRQVAVKTGMRIEGGRVGHFLLDGKPVDVVYYGKMRG